MRISEDAANDTPSPLPLPVPSRRRRRLRYLIPRFDATIVLRAEIPRLAGRQVPPTPFPYRVGPPQEVRGYLANLPPEERKSALRRAETADLVVYSLADRELAFWEFVQLGHAQLPPDVWRPGGSDRPAYVFGAFTRPAHRGQGLFTGGLQWLLDWLAEHGYTHLYSQPAMDDVVSLLAHLSAGFEALGEGRHLHWCGRRIVRRTRLLLGPVAAGSSAEPDLSALSAAARRSLQRALLRPP